MLLEHLRSVRSSCEFESALVWCRGCERFSGERYFCSAVAEECGCGGGSVLGLAVDGKPCPLNKWQALDVESIVSRGV